MPSEQLVTLLNLLHYADLPHLFSVLNESTTLVELQQKAATTRPLLLSYLRELGVQKLGERQSLANAIAKAEKEGRLPPPPRPIPHLQPPVFDEDDQIVTVRLLVPPATSANQLKLRVDANSLCVELQGMVTACNGKLHDLIKPTEYEWELERTPRPEYDPFADANAQPAAPDDTMVITLQKALPGRWITLFSNAQSKRYIAPAPAPAPESDAQKERKHALSVKKRDAMHGIGFVPRKLDLEKRQQRQSERAWGQGRGSELPAASASEHWPAALAQLVWRDGRSSQSGCPDHPEDSDPLYIWVEHKAYIIVEAPTRRGLPTSALSFKPRPSSVECLVCGVPTPWCGHLVGKILPAECSFEVVRSPEPDALTDTLRLTLVKAHQNALWRAPWPELLSQLDLKDKRALVRRPGRSEISVGGFDSSQIDGFFEVQIQYKAGPEQKKYLADDDLRVGLTADALNVHIAGQEDAPLLGGHLGGKIDVARSSYRIQKGKKKDEKRVGCPVEELVLSLRKVDGSGHWRDLFKLVYA